MIAGKVLKVITTSSVDAEHGELLIVHLKVYVFPATPLKVEVGLDGLVTLPPDPLIIPQFPVPTIGAFAARVTVVNPQVEVPV